MAQQIIVSGKLDYADGTFLIRDERTLKTRSLAYYIAPCIGKRIVVSLEEPEEELEPIISKRLKELIWPTKA